jgi:hypothetical protein
MKAIEDENFKLGRDFIQGMLKQPPGWTSPNPPDKPPVINQPAPGGGGTPPGGAPKAVSPGATTLPPTISPFAKSIGGMGGVVDTIG